VGKPVECLSEKEYRMVRYCGSRGISWADIARLVGVNLRKLERDKLAQEEYRIGRAGAKLKISETFFQMATSGNFPVMTIFAAKVICGFKEDGTSFADDVEEAVKAKLVLIPNATFGKVKS
jgi:hypothetical protein